MSHSVKVMLVTSDERFADDLSNLLSSSYPGINATFDICDVECADCLISDDCPAERLFKYDIYICYQQGQFLKTDQLLKFVNILKKKSNNTDIFVACAGKDPYLLESLLKIGIEGTINLEHPNYSGVINSIKGIDEIYQKFSSMFEKMQRIEATIQSCR